eukprot:TRINITY_DN12165_c1_g1_i1.p1 TRINITY_DN12165_c1_g1~~TRINITY_DN12165_c1_g1_i1.p1  ORF type:complete len:249 (+),score=37.43 TRINITY_DN12165_c1_g1_i1:61-747(+)
MGASIAALCGMQFYDITLDEIKHEYDQVYTYKFSSSNGQPIPYQAGQMAHLGAPGCAISREFVRHMSFASPTEDNQYVFSMDVSSKTPYKTKFAESKVGDKAQMFKIRGEFLVDPDVHKEVVFVAGGIGITPMRALIRDILNRNLPVSFGLIHIARTGHLYQEEFQALDFPQARTNHAGSDAVFTEWTKQKPQAYYYLCGSDRFVKGVRQRLVELGIPEEKIRAENFH